ncbi:sel1 domain-containing protein repeat-containing protein [Geoanaerobacter pelophilus]|uniref:Sel1 domain-containing protein repeat-containing protein n=1 Tax=Geoanaerobacter pelophilus TaxID=60036 RepID=A0ABQ0MEV9_9BACT|nr:sel1 domain-containing protein repeat-containing protein [Geoanaerobacter pelophilus]
MAKWGVALRCALLLFLQSPQGFGFDGVDVSKVRQMAEEGNAEAQSKLGVLYASGVGMPRDKREAAKWYSRSAEQGYPLGQWNLAFMYLRGDGGLKEDPEKARDLLQKAADSGLAAAQYDLGMMYLYGVAVPQSRDEAEKWLRRSAGQGYREAKKTLEEVLAR